MAAKTFYTRVQNKIDAHENWMLAEAQGLQILPDELAISVVPAASDSTDSLEKPAVLIKVGQVGPDGSTPLTYSELDYIYAKAADVHEWAKAELKPVYQASEIQGLEDFISGEIQDTNTTYQIVSVEVEGVIDPYKFMLQAKEVGGEWEDVGGFEVPNTENAIAEAIANLATTEYVDEAVASVLGTPEDTAEQDTVYGAKAAAVAAQQTADGAQTAADAAAALAATKVADVIAADASLVIEPVEDTEEGMVELAAKVQISATEGNSLSVVDDGLFVSVPEGADYTVTVTESTPEGYAKAYTFSQLGADIATINIPVDLVVSSGTVETYTAETLPTDAGAPTEAGTYLVLVLANTTADKIYINVSDLIEYVSSGSVEGDQIQIAVSSDYKVTATLADGSVSLAQLHADTVAAFDPAGSATAVQEAVTGTPEDTTDALTLNGLSNRIAAAEEVTTNLATVAHTGEISDLVQTQAEDDTTFANYIILNCGSSTTVI